MKNSLLFLLLLSLQAFAQPTKFRVEFDYSRFVYNDTSEYVEMYYSFYQGQFKAADLNGIPTTQGELSVVIVDKKTADTVINKKYHFSNTYNDSARGKALIGTLGYQLMKGTYRCTLRGRDINDASQIDSASFDILVAPPAKDRISMSDIQTASSIVRSENTGSPFYKNSYEVMPNPSNVYSNEMPVVYYYAELYNLDKGTAAGQLKVDCSLYNSSNLRIYHKNRLIAAKNGSIVEVGTINVKKHPSGAYNLIVTLTDTVKQISASISKKIFLYNPGVVDSSYYLKNDDSYISSEFSTMSIEDINESFAPAKYLASTNEIEQWNKLVELEAKRKFMYVYWQKRDNDPQTPENEFKKEFNRRISVANSKYNSFQKKGWQTDRGRVYIQHGEPDEIERFPAEIDSKPYEIWYYHSIEGGVQFVFADLSGFSDFQLVHSTLRGELRDDYYLRRVKQTN